MEGQTFEEPLAELSEEEKSFLVCAAAVVLLALGACLRATSHHWSHVSTFCKKNFLNLINRPQNEESRWERRSLYMQVCLQKVILAEIYWRYSACWLIFLTLTRASRILTKDPVWISSFAAWGWVLLAFLIIVWTQVPCATQTWSLDFVCILWYLATGFYLSSWVIPVEQLLLMEFVLFVLVALPLCTFAKHYSVVFLCQGGLMAFVVARAVLEDLPRKRISSQHSVVVLNIVFLGVTLLVHFLSNSFLEQTVELRVREADSQTQRNATSSLLELTCDAVVHLDSELRVTSDARDALAAMLFRSPETLRGTKFTELIATDCQSRAEEMLKEAQAPAHAFHTQLVDGCSSRFRTEVFQVKYTKMNGQRCHLLGLRDFTDVKPLSRPSPDALAADALSVDPDVHSYEMGSLDLASRSDESSVQMPQQLLRPPPRRLTRVMLETGGGCSRVHPNGVIEHYVNIQAKFAFLDINVDRRVITAASAPCSDLVGQKLEDVFPNEFTWQIVHNVCEEARSFMLTSPGDQVLPDQVAAFNDMPMTHSSGRIVGISGLMRVLLTEAGQFHVILSFVSPKANLVAL